MKCMWFCAFILIIQFNLYSGTYYVDNEKGNDSNNGTSESAAWKSISKVNTFKFKGGDNICFKAGGIWREQLNISISGTSSSPLVFRSYGEGSKPVLSGSNVLTGFQQHSSSVWKLSSGLPRQVFFNNIRGNKSSSTASLKSERDWFHERGTLYIMAFNPATSYSSIEASVRPYAIYVNASNILIKGLQIEKTVNDGIYISANSVNVTAEKLDILQWTDEINSARGGAAVLGKDCKIEDCTFGRDTGDEIADQNWAGFVGIIVSGQNNEIAGNRIYHTSLENENSNGKYAYGIRVIKASGVTRIHNNKVFHTGSNGILTETSSKSGDEIRIYENTVSYTGQAGIAAFKTRASDGKGGKGYVYKNDVSYSNRLGGDVGGGGNRAAGIHFNDGEELYTSSANPFIKWYCYENTVYNSHSPRESRSPDSDGIAIDYNANKTEVYRNIVYNNDGKGIYIWNADDCKVYYNIVYGNDCGITVTAANENSESAKGNVVCNNVFYKNYNGESRGPNYDTEIYFGMNGKENKFINNILYASGSGTAYYYNPKNSFGCVIDYNVIYSEKGSDAQIGYDGNYGRQNFAAWKSTHNGWDKNSINKDPLFVNTSSFDFRLKRNSPAINKGMSVGVLADFLGLPVIGLPDIGAFENSNLINKIDIKLYLEGPFRNDSMYSNLSLPSSNPYSVAPWNYNGTETIQPGISNIVDWVLMELRSGIVSNSRIYSAALLLKTDGTIVSPAGGSISFPDIPGKYYIVIHHRNHLSVMSSRPIDFSEENISYDFTSTPDKAYGSNSLIRLPNGKYALIAGDSNANGIIDSLDFSEVGSNIFQEGYENSDLDMNEVVNILDYQKSLNNLSKTSHVPE